jgi:hypothetical protein
MHQSTGCEISYTKSEAPNGEELKQEMVEGAAFQPTKINTGVKDDSAKALKAREKVIKQLSNMYKNTRMAKYLIENSPIPFRIEYKKIKGLMLNIAKRLSWYMDVEEEEIKCLLISIKARSFKTDITEEEKDEGFFEYYAKAIFTEEGETKFIIVPLYNLNIRVI